MPNLVTIWTFPYQHQLLIVRGRLEAEGIETFAQDELTIQVDPLYSNALGGIKLMVRQEDAARAAGILAEAGFIKEKEKLPFQFLQVFSGATAKWPVIGKLSLERRVAIIIPLVILITGALIYLFVR